MWLAALACACLDWSLPKRMKGEKNILTHQFFHSSILSPWLFASESNNWKCAGLGEKLGSGVVRLANGRPGEYALPKPRRSQRKPARWVL